MPGDPRQARESALRRLLRAKRWILALSVALTGALGGLAANAFPGKSIKGHAPGAGAEPGSQPASSTEGSSASLTPPEQAPQGAESAESSGEQGAAQPAEAPVLSGGS